MKLWLSENDRVKKQAGEQAVIFLQGWKNKVRRYRIYRRCLIGALFLSCCSLLGVTYYQIDSSIPSVIHVKANEEQSFLLGIPAKAEIVSVSEQGESNIPAESITVDLSEKITVKADASDDLQMNVKLFGLLPFKQVGIEVIQSEELIPVGVPVGIYVETEGVLVIGVGEFDGENGQKYSPSQGILKSGDYIITLNGEAVTEKDDFIEAIEECSGEEQLLSVNRNGEIVNVTIQPEKNQSGKYKIGAWVRDNAQGVGTMTYIDEDGNFGALGHGINDIDTSALMEMNDGTLYETQIVNIEKGTAGTPGEMTGLIVYREDRILGDIINNSEKGIFGVCNEKGMELASSEALPIGLKQEIEKGYAQILCTVDGTTKYYDIEIKGVRLDNDNVNRGIELEVTDPELIELTGGIVQGMSGSPIIQNGKIVGAVTHVLVSDPTRGYGIFIENMLEH